MDGKNEEMEVRRDAGSIQATLVGPCSWPVKGVDVVQRFFWCAVCWRGATRATKWILCRGIGLGGLQLLALSQLPLVPSRASPTGPCARAH